MKRVNVVGTSCSGKTTLARAISRRLELPHVELDALFSLVRIRSGQEFWPGTGNRETLRNAFKADGLLWWILRTHHDRRRTMAEAMVLRRDLEWVRLRSPKEAERWLVALQPPGHR